MLLNQQLPISQYSIIVPVSNYIIVFELQMKCFYDHNRFNKINITTSYFLKQDLKTNIKLFLWRGNGIVMFINKADLKIYFSHVVVVVVVLLLAPKCEEQDNGFIEGPSLAADACNGDCTSYIDTSVTTQKSGNESHDWIIDK